MIGKMRIPLARPDIGAREIDAACGVLRPDRLAMGARTVAFEKAMACAAGTAHAVAVNSGTSALHLIIRGLGIGPGDEVITTPFSFIASTNCILFEQAVPVFVDIDPLTLCMDPEQVERAISPRTKAILAVDVFGHPADWPALERIAGDHGLLLIEDSAESLGSSLDGRSCGSFGKAAVFGFYPNKQITTGEGGVLVTDDPELAALARSMANQGRSAEAGWLSHVRLGYNYRMSEVTAAIGVAQLARLGEFVQRRGEAAARYAESLKEADCIILPQVSERVQMSWFVYVVRMAGHATRQDRDRVLDFLRSKGIGCRDYFQPIHLQPFIRAQLGTRPGQFPVTESAGDRSIALPFYAGLTGAEVEYVAAAVGQALESLT